MKLAGRIANTNQAQQLDCVMRSFVVAKHIRNLVSKSSTFTSNEEVDIYAEEK